MKFWCSVMSTQICRSAFCLFSTENRIETITLPDRIESRICYPSSREMRTVGILTCPPLPSSIITIRSGFSLRLSIIMANFPPYSCTLIDFWVKLQSLRSTSRMLLL